MLILRILRNIKFYWITIRYEFSYVVLDLIWLKWGIYCCCVTDRKVWELVIVMSLDSSHSFPLTVSFSFFHFIWNSWFVCLLILIASSFIGFKNFENETIFMCKAKTCDCSDIFVFITAYYILYFPRQ